MADARRVQVRIYHDGRFGPYGPPIQERLRVTLPDTGKVSDGSFAREYRSGRCKLVLEAYTYPDAKRKTASLVRRFPYANGYVYLRARGGQRCASGFAARTVRSARLDRSRLPCDALGTTRAENDQVRVYEVRTRLWVCATANRYRFDIGISSAGNGCGGGDFCSENLPTVAGPFVAYTSEYAGRRDSSSQVSVRDARTGAEVHSLQSGRDCGDPRYQAGPVHSLVLTPEGTPAWIVADCFVYQEPRVYEVRTLAGVVSSGAGIDPGSLTLAGDTISWVQDGAVRQSRIDSPRIARAMTSF
ncbi:hypothetical protein OJ997_14225 [Solirubrobacter phytolaccae]|uniref:Uncharacterized protein n=1 Tax=Solirubrobacter phytolaccae TaxID=1404360 RepID=A0A9X3SFF1_9ACTN|nr:hypothetical protein [Solirubrobacter phytolaccae]MDA0181457.1 hypothetical protein [Solirubrobacter phytolaccae]